MAFVEGAMRIRISFLHASGLALAVAATSAHAQTPDTAVTLPGVVTAAPVVDRSLMEFERRREHGGGVFITPEQLKHDIGRPLADAITLHIPSLVAATRMGETESPLAKYIMARSGPKGGCYPDIYIDGSPIGAPKGAAEISIFQTTDFSAIEYHTGSNVPPQFNRATNMCGVLLLWRKTR
jgi:hypothetical protein